ncbi:MAG: hypothetical protein CXX81_11620, partial [Methanobacteriota archaeon]
MIQSPSQFLSICIVKIRGKNKHGKSVLNSTDLSYENSDLSQPIIPPEEGFFEVGFEDADSR